MADDDNFSQEEKRLKIETVLKGGGTPGGDPLLLVSIEGTEHFSKPFSYAVKMWRSPKKPAIDPAGLIKTPVTFSFKIAELTEDVERPFGQNKTVFFKESEQITFVERSGIFETLRIEGTLHDETGGVDDNFVQYSGTIVPAFKMLEYETAFRVFEQKDVKQIITQLMKTEPLVADSNVEFDASLKDKTFPKMPYCVQFRESTYNFLSRLMNQFGIWYYFDHNRDKRAAPRTSTMILGAGAPSANNFPACQTSHPLVFTLDQMVTTLRPASPTTIQDFGLFCQPAKRFRRGGNFNQLDPTNPFSGETSIQKDRDLLKNGGADADQDRFRLEEFHIPVSGEQEARDYAEVQMHSAEPIVLTANGNTKNSAFLPGYTFKVVGTDFTKDSLGRSALEDEEEKMAGSSDIELFDTGVPHSVPGSIPGSLPFDPRNPLGTHLITFVRFGGTEQAYQQKKGLFEDFLDLWWPSGVTPVDVLANFTNQGLNNYLQNGMPIEISKAVTLPRGGDTPYFVPFFFGGGFAALASAIPPFVKAIQNQLADKQNEFHCSFSAIPLTGPNAASFNSLPLPTDWVKPTASGPHLAVVIGKDGIDTSKSKKEIFADGLGRVRVRFPWDRKAGEKAGDQFKRGDAACWVRVSEGWAGRDFGTQFLPRIGQEVIVDFIDGDPDRPIVTGRVYNADKGHANLPFPEGQVIQELVDQDALLSETVDAGFTDFRFSGLKTCSTPRPDAGDPDRYHLQRFDDTLNCEQYLLRSQGRLDVTAFAHSFETTYGNRNVKVVPGKKNGQQFGGSSLITVGGNYNLHAGGAFYGQVEKNYELTVKADTSLDLEGKLTAIVGKKLSLNAPSIVLEASEKLTLKVGGSSIVITPGNVYIFGVGGTHIDQLTGGPDNIDHADMQPVSDAAAAEPGDKPNSRLTPCDPSPSHSGGGSGSWSGKPRQAKEHHGLAPPDLTLAGAQQEFADEELREGKFFAIPGKTFSGPTGP